jgi:hypothetical protein
MTEQTFTFTSCHSVLLQLHDLDGAKDSALTPPTPISSNCLSMCALQLHNLRTAKASADQTSAALQAQLHQSRAEQAASTDQVAMLQGQVEGLTQKLHVATQDGQIQAAAAQQARADVGVKEARIRCVFPWTHVVLWRICRVMSCHVMTQSQCVPTGV